MLFGEITVLCSENHMKRKNTLYGGKSRFLSSSKQEKYVLYSENDMESKNTVYGGKPRFLSPSKHAVHTVTCVF
jgi:hypothetical protein